MSAPTIPLEALMQANTALKLAWDRTMHPEGGAPVPFEVGYECMRAQVALQYHLEKSGIQVEVLQAATETPQVPA